jgi:hypothetical protein
VLELEVLDEAYTAELFGDIAEFHWIVGLQASIQVVII